MRKVRTTFRSYCIEKVLFFDVDKLLETFLAGIKHSMSL